MVSQLSDDLESLDIFLKLTEEGRSTEVGNMRFGMSQRPRYVDKEKDGFAFCAGACAHCANSPPAPPGLAKHLHCLYQATDPLDSAHDWSDSPRVKHALFVWGETSAKDPKFKDGALVKRLQLWPNDPASEVTTPFDCEKKAGFTIWASNSGAAQVGHTTGQLPL